jgi:4-hydroxybenzoyl-CoA reductase subunit beta
MAFSEFQLARPRTAAEAVALLAQHGAAAQIIAGGTDLVPSMSQRLFTPKVIVDIRGIRELHGIVELSDGCIAIGAATPIREIERSGLIRSRYPVLAEAARTIASPVIRNMATIGGNICLDTRCLWYNQSLQWRRSCGFCIKKDGDLCHVAPGGPKCWAAFSADTPPALLCLGAEIEIASAAGTRRIPLSEFYTGEGDARITLERDELLTRVILPAATAGWRGAYRKLRIRGSIDYPLAGVAVALQGNGTVSAARIALTGVNPAPVLLRQSAVDALLAGKPLTEDLATEIGELAARTAKPLTTSALTPEYRREMVRVFAKRALLSIADH